MNKILIRPLRFEDASVSWKWRNDSEVWEHTGSRPDIVVTEEIEKQWILDKLKERNSVRFAIEVDDVYVGNIQLTNIVENETAEYHVFIGDKSYWGKGVASLATSQIIRFAKNVFNLQSIYLSVKPENKSAIRVYEKSGFVKINEDVKMTLDLSKVITPLVSVFMMAYNHEKYIAEAIEGVLMQKTSFDFDIVIGEDCSTDNTRQIILDYQQKYPGKFKLLLHEENIGAMANQQAVFNACTGKYIAMCEGDDYWTDPLKLQKQVEFLEENEEYGMIHTNYAYFFEKTKKRVDTVNKKTVPTGNVLNEIFSGRLGIKTATVCYRRSIVNKYFPKEYYKLNIPIGDWPLWLVLAKNSKIGYIDEITTVYRTGQFSYVNVHSHNFEVLEKRYIDEKRMYDFMCNLYPDDLIKDDWGWNNYKYISLLNAAIKKNNFNKASEYSQILISRNVNTYKTKISTNRFLFYLYQKYLWIKFSLKMVITGQS